MDLLINTWKNKSIDVLSGFLFPMWVSSFQLILAALQPETQCCLLLSFPRPFLDVLVQA